MDGVAQRDAISARRQKPLNTEKSINRSLRRGPEEEILRLKFTLNKK